MGDKFKKTALWKRTLEPREGDPLADERATLRTAYLGMRKRVEPIAAGVHHDCNGLTVHDVTHLDALWETADKVIGEEYPVNPVEAFVFGAAALIHDAALAIAAYPNGLDDLKQTKAWRDAVRSALRRNDRDPDSVDLSDPPTEIIDSVIFNVLRLTHAEQAEKMMAMKWGDPKELYLLESTDLRLFYGSRIGRIAHSHHWDIERVASEFSKEVSAMTDLDSSWILNEVKVACMLRCTDASHIDERRAPKMLYAIKNPEGVSRDHWVFQGKMGQLSRVGDALIYSSEDFNESEVTAWWLAYDVAEMIDDELKNSNAILEERGIETFAAKGVRGASSPKLFSRDVRVSGWEPVQAEVRVTDPVHLALTLGGKNLYGQGFKAPVRELFQNAVDAVDAVRGRRGARSVEDFTGRIRITIERDAADGSVQLHFDDNGMGMSQRVLVGPLIDFGRSVWSSSMLLEEYPDLDPSSAKPVGKFGIGFFSIFLLGQDVRVTSRRYGDATRETKSLEFSSLTRRPIIRTASENCLPDEFSTRVSVTLQNPEIVEEQPDGFGEDDVFQYIKHLSAAVDIEVQIVDLVSSRSYIHSAWWLDTSPDVFLEELLSIYGEAARERTKKGYGNLLRTIRTSEGKVVGRAALLLEGGAADLNRSFVSVQGVVYPAAGGSRVRFGMSGRYGRMRDLFYVGVISGNTDNAAREGAYVSLDDSDLAKWITEQASLIEMSKHEALSLLPIARHVILKGGDSQNIPIMFHAGKLTPYSDVVNYVSKANSVRVLLSKNYLDGPEWMDVQSLSASLFINEVDDDLFAISTDGEDLTDSDSGREMLKSLPREVSIEEISFGTSGGDIFKGILDEQWGDYKAVIDYEDVFSGKFRIPAPSRLIIRFLRQKAP